MGAACGLCRWGSARSPRGWRGVVSPSSACFKFTVEPVAKFDFPAFNFMLFHALVFAYLVRALFAADLCCNGCEGLWNGLRVHGGGGGAVGGDGGEEKGSKSHYFFFCNLGFSFRMSIWLFSFLSSSPLFFLPFFPFSFLFFFSFSNPVKPQFKMQNPACGVLVFIFNSSNQPPPIWILFSPPLGHGHDQHSHHPTAFCFYVHSYS